ncbi:unnamed protein product [Ectocarpus sp. 12 AP-2014]
MPLHISFASPDYSPTCPPFTIEQNVLTRIPDIKRGSKEWDETKTVPVLVVFTSPGVAFSPPWRTFVVLQPNFVLELAQQILSYVVSSLLRNGGNCSTCRTGQLLRQGLRQYIVIHIYGSIIVGFSYGGSRQIKV